MKNLNSLRSLGRAIEYEIERQTGIVSAGGSVVQQTRHWDEQHGVTVALRSKEEAFDYRYFSEPDLVPVAPDPSWLHEVASAIGPMPANVVRPSTTRSGDRRLPPSPTRSSPWSIWTSIRWCSRPWLPASTPGSHSPHGQRGGRSGRAGTVDRPGLVHSAAPDGAAGGAHGDPVEDRARRDARVGRGPGLIARAKGFEALAADSLGELVGR